MKKTKKAKSKFHAWEPEENLLGISSMRPARIANEAIERSMHRVRTTSGYEVKV